MKASDDFVTYDSRENIAIISLNRPQALNALNEEMIQSLIQAWHRFNESDDRCAILRGNGGRAFCTGIDVKAPPRDMWRCVPMIGVEVEKPIVAALDGYCIGGGYVLMSVCDLAVATERTVIGYPEAKLGYTGGIGVNIGARVPHKIAMEFLLVGEPLSAKRACEVGLINRVVPAGEEMTAAMQYARTIAENAPLVVKALKAWTQELFLPLSQAEISAKTQRLLYQMEQSEDFKEGKASFREKRKPIFKGR